MKQITPIDIEVVKFHLNRHATGIGLSFPQEPYQAFRALLDEEDVESLILWGQHSIHTTDRSRRIRMASPVSASHERIQPFIEGDSGRNLHPADLRFTESLEPVLESRWITGPFNAIDGNHRMLAQQITGKPFQGVPVFLCIHPRIPMWSHV